MTGLSLINCLISARLRALNSVWSTITSKQSASLMHSYKEAAFVAPKASGQWGSYTTRLAPNSLSFLITGSEGLNLESSTSALYAVPSIDILLFLTPFPMVFKAVTVRLTTWSGISSLIFRAVLTRSQLDSSDLWVNK